MVISSNYAFTCEKVRLRFHHHYDMHLKETDLSYMRASQLQIHILHGLPGHHIAAHSTTNTIKIPSPITINHNH